MSTTRGAVAANSRRVKQRLVHLLFGHKYVGKGWEAHKKLDFAAYSYADLRSAYLKRIHELHPDKYAHKKASKISVKTQNEDNYAGVKFSSNMQNEFVLLQEAWANYDEVAKTMKRVSKGDEIDANFTMFGVGCSFADSPEERELRSDIMDQAGRGWFTSGLLSEDTPENDAVRVSVGESNSSRISLCDDDFFVSNEERGNGSITRKAEYEKRSLNRSKRKSLVDHMIPRGKQP